jgi:hypothetical protein
VVGEQIQSVSQGRLSLEIVRAEILAGALSPGTRVILGRASRVRKKGWFKSITAMEHVAYTIVGPALSAPEIDAGFREIVLRLFGWAYSA